MKKRREIYHGRIVRLGLEDAQLPNGARVELEIIRHPGAAAIVPLHADGTVTLVRQYRHAVGCEIYEAPAGVLEKGEDPVTCAERELAEEVQLQADRYIHLGTIHTTPGFTDETIWIYLANDLRPVAGKPDWDESLAPVRLPFAQVLTMIANGQITDGKTICALHLAACHAGVLASSSHTLPR